MEILLLPSLLFQVCKAKFLRIAISCQGNGLIFMSEEKAEAGRLPLVAG